MQRPGPLATSPRPRRRRRDTARACVTEGPDPTRFFAPVHVPGHADDRLRPVRSAGASGAGSATNHAVIGLFFGACAPSSVLDALRHILLMSGTRKRGGFLLVLGAYREQLDHRR